MTESRPECFARLSRVFPLGDDGLREVNPDCQSCPQVTACLKAAAESADGVEFRAERMAAMSGHTRPGLRGFLSRWSELKSMRRRAETVPRRRGNR